MLNHSIAGMHKVYSTLNKYIMFKKRNPTSSSQIVQMVMMFDYVVFLHSDDILRPVCSV